MKRKSIMFTAVCLFILMLFPSFILAGCRGQDKASYAAFVVSGDSDGALGGILTEECGIWQHKMDSSFHDDTAPESMTISFDGSEYSGAYDKTSTYLPHVHDVHKYAGKDIWFHVDSVSGDVVGISFLYEPDNRATITEDECRAKAESIASQYIDIGKYQLEINRTEIYDNYLMKYTYYCEVLGCQTADRLSVTIDGNGKVFAFIKGDVGTVVNQEYKPLSLTMDDLQRIINEKLDDIVKGKTGVTYSLKKIMPIVYNSEMIFWVQASIRHIEVIDEEKDEYITYGSPVDLIIMMSDNPGGQ